MDKYYKRKSSSDGSFMTMTQEVKSVVRSRYAASATNSRVEACCDSAKLDRLLSYGYSPEELDQLPESVVVMAAGCGNPTALGMIEPGDTVLDLGSGGGIDVLLASKKVGENGRVIGLDMTPEMVGHAIENAKKMGVKNVEFKLGEIEKIPLNDESVDVIMSNCVICLSPDKNSVFREMYRVLRSGGRLAIADEIATRPFSEEEKSDPEKWCSCITGAITEREYSRMLEDTGFRNVYVKRLTTQGEQPTRAVFSAFVMATKL